MLVAEAPNDALDAARRRALAEVSQDEVLRAQLLARVMRHRADVDRLWEPGPESFPEIELAGTARIGQIRAATQMTDARRLLDVLVGTFALLEAGVVFQPTAELLLSLTRNCSDRVAVEVERRVLTRLATLGTTDARRLLEAVIPEVEADLDPELTRQRLEDARRDRGVWISPMPDAMCQVGASLDVLTGRRWSLDFEELVRAQKVLDHRDGRQRTQAQRRADVFAQLPSRLLALIQSVQQGRTDELLALARLDPEAVVSLQELVASTTDLTAEHDSAPPPATVSETPTQQAIRGR